ncbi:MULTISPECIES: hypothetical protein [Azospirillum]|uniref:Baseplate protein J-like domain-containing protein n=1 Tax=Azospirillum brasilense TaxID=192 RepID=A0ABU4P6P3_AZOBR|nr:MULTISPECIES: hypothetical protein [Azospirillum]MDW7597430.1 hypothetical protein [Azospirillum brasilense]MDW7632693.1 hypothetical protein [Azospirillum brasilense]MDX5952436.1 hypothetical protein [Azospirillum brasilense]
MPIEIRENDLTLVQRCTVGTVADAVAQLGTGDYLLTVLLPFGTQITQRISVTNGGGIDFAALCRRVALHPSVADLLNNIMGNRLVNRMADWASWAFGAPSATVATASKPLNLEQMGAVAGDATAKVRLYNGVAFGGLHRATADTMDVQYGQGALHVFGTNTPQAATIQILQPNRTPINVVVPPGAVASVSLDDRRSAAAARVTLTLGVGIVDEMVRLRTDSRLQDIVTVVASLSRDDIDRYIAQHTGAAVATTYALLRTAPASLVDAAIAALDARPVRFADVALIRAERAARDGRYADALLGFVAAADRGLPMFSYGMNYLIDRLRFYAMTGHSTAQGRALNLPASDLATASSALERYQRFALFTDFDEAVLTYTGLDPEAPDNETLAPSDFSTSDGMALTPGEETPHGTE